jgi:hypothetical protein
VISKIRLFVLLTIFIFYNDTFSLSSTYLYSENLVSTNIIYEKNVDSVSSSCFRIKIGSGLNNQIFNIEASYLFPLSKSLVLAIDARFYNFISFTSYLEYNIPFTKEIHLAPKLGIGVIAPGPILGIESVTLEMGFNVLYNITSDVSLGVEYKQIYKSSISDGIRTLPPTHLISDFPIRLFSIFIQF